MTSYLMKTCLIWTEEAPLYITLAEADVEDLAVGRHVGVVPVCSTLAIEAQIARNLGKILTGNGSQQNGSGNY